jgi:hypothetical protein
MVLARLGCDVRGLLGLVGSYSVRGEPYHRSNVIFVALLQCASAVMYHVRTPQPV